MSKPSLQQLREAFAQNQLFADKTWRLSPEAFPLSAAQLNQIREIGNAVADFYRAIDRLYHRVTEDRSLLRNQDLKAPWVSSYYDRGKPDDLLFHGQHRANRHTLPPVIRPDLLITGEGFTLSEIDSVPGGIGLTAYLNQIYGDGDDQIIGTAQGMVQGFFRAVVGEEKVHRNPFLAILVSEEAATYRPEMEWLAATLQRQGQRAFVFDPAEVLPLGDSLCVALDGSPQQIDVIFRFFELFDLPNLGLRSFIFNFVEQGMVQLTPPMKAFQEEKLSLALFHHPRLRGYWEENLPAASFRVLRNVIPESWIVDPAPVPPHTSLLAPPIRGEAPASWDDLALGSQRERSLILKISGYHETAWGARSVVLGSDVPREVWAHALHQAITSGEQHPYVLQRYHKPKRINHPLFEEDGSIRNMDTRVRLCPYFFAQPDGSYELEGILATLCPADKKIIHGMSDAALLPCKLLTDKEP